MKGHILGGVLPIYADLYVLFTRFAEKTVSQTVSALCKDIRHGSDRFSGEKMGVTKSDEQFLILIGNFNLLNVSQLSTLSRRSDQAVRRRLRALKSEDLIATLPRGYGRVRGRPQELIILTEKGIRFLQEIGTIESLDVGSIRNKIGSASVDHELLVNWFRIHLLQIGRVNQDLSVHCLSFSNHNSRLRDNHRLLINVPSTKRENELIQFIPDEIFSIKLEQSENKKSLLFFLEVDMGTETIASIDRDSKDIRQKIINYQALYISGGYKRYEKIFDSKFNGFRLLLLTNTTARFAALCRLVQEMPPSDFVWLTDQEKMFSKGLFGDIWASLDFHGSEYS